MNLYCDFKSQEEIDKQYNVAATTPGRESFLNHAITESEKTRRNLNCKLDIRYGPSLDELSTSFLRSRPTLPFWSLFMGVTGAT